MNSSELLDLFLNLRHTSQLVASILLVFSHSSKSAGSQELQISERGSLRTKISTNPLPLRTPKVRRYKIAQIHQPQPQSSPGRQYPPPSASPVITILPLEFNIGASPVLASPLLLVGLELTSTSMGVNFLSSLGESAERDCRRLIARGIGELDA